ncbi:hypothetical protein SUGI_0970310 [Cryptomeria japonica]|nr:hypothetical protein SUGI_0970310 [Cryptomeria japonica]
MCVGRYQRLFLWPLSNHRGRCNYWIAQGVKGICSVHQSVIVEPAAKAMSYQNERGTADGYPPPGYAAPYPYPPPGYQGPPPPGYAYPPPPPGYQPPPEQHCCHQGPPPPPGYQQGYQGYFNQGYPPQQYPPPPQYAYAEQPQPSYGNFLEGCLAALCCCCLLEECCP